MLTNEYSFMKKESIPKAQDTRLNKKFQDLTTINYGIELSQCQLTSEFRIRKTKAITKVNEEM
jgi:hypothetical protein